MKEFKCIVRISAENDADLLEQLEALDGFCDADLEWFVGIEI